MSVRHVSVRTQMHIAAPRAEVWDAITGDVSAWWGAPYLLLPQARSIRVEPRLGGLVREESADASALWGIVVFIEPAHEIAWHGTMGMGPAATGTVTIRLEDRADGGTLVTLEHEAIGLLGEGTQVSYDTGWNDLLQRLRALLEDGEATGVSGLDPPASDPRPAPCDPAAR